MKPFKLKKIENEEESEEESCDEENDEENRDYKKCCNYEMETLCKNVLLKHCGYGLVTSLYEIKNNISDDVLEKNFNENHGLFMKEKEDGNHASYKHFDENGKEIKYWTPSLGKRHGVLSVISSNKTKLKKKFLLLCTSVDNMSNEFNNYVKKFKGNLKDLMTSDLKYKILLKCCYNNNTRLAYLASILLGIDINYEADSDQCCNDSEQQCRGFRGTPCFYQAQNILLPTKDEKCVKFYRKVSPNLNGLNKEFLTKFCPLLSHMSSHDHKLSKKYKNKHYNILFSGGDKKVLIIKKNDNLKDFNDFYPDFYEKKSDKYNSLCKNIVRVGKEHKSKGGCSYQHIKDFEGDSKYYKYDNLVYKEVN